MKSDYLKIENLSCGYSNGFNLKNISIALHKGVFAGITGPNGSGKTTLFKAISGSFALKKSIIMLGKSNLGRIKPQERARMVAQVAQFPEIAEMTVEEYVMLGRIPYRDPFQFFESSRDMVIARRYMNLTGIIDLRSKMMNELSGGEQQLAAIAQALTQEPELVLLDEPTSHLDISHTVQILNLIQKLNRNTGLTVLMILHDLNIAAEYCDYLLMLDNGRIYAQGTPSEVLTYQNIEAVYKTVVVTRENPLSGKPAIFLVSENIMQEQREKYGGITR